MKTTRYRIDRIHILNHHHCIIAKCASTTIKRLGVRVTPPFEPLQTVATIRHPLDRWISGYVMWLLDLARWTDGYTHWQHPHHVMYDTHTSKQSLIVQPDSLLIRFDDVGEYVERCGYPPIHEHPTNRGYIPLKDKTLEYIQDNKPFADKLNRWLHDDFLLYNQCQSVQSLPDRLFL